LCKELDEKFIEALNDLEKVVIPESDIEILHENVASNRSEFNGEFLEAWKTLNTQLSEKFILSQELTKEELKMKLTISSLMKLIEKYNFLEPKTIHKINELRNIRHQVVHDTSNNLTEKQLELKTKELKQLCNEIMTMTITETTDQTPNT